MSIACGENNSFHVRMVFMHPSHNFHTVIIAQVHVRHEDINGCPIDLTDGLVEVFVSNHDGMRCLLEDEDQSHDCHCIIFEQKDSLRHRSSSYVVS